MENELNEVAYTKLRKYKFF